MEQKCSNCGNGKWRDGVTAITDTCTKCHYVDKGALGIQPNNWKPKEQTNADRIRAMSDEELARWISDMWHGFVSNPWCDLRCQNCREGDDYRCEKCALEWLKQPVE